MMTSQRIVIAPFVSLPLRVVNVAVNIAVTPVACERQLHLRLLHPAPKSVHLCAVQFGSRVGKRPVV
jgi:hypothetical protein